jgi:hypothetical protein
MLVDGGVREFGVHFDGVACIVADPKITIVPGFTPTFFIPDLEKTRPRRNQIVYRVYDVAAGSQNGRFWTPVDPELPSFGPDNFRVIAGLPDRLTQGDGLITGLLRVTEGAISAVRPALPVKPSDDDEPGPSYRKYPGGLLEYVIENAIVNVHQTSMEVLPNRYGGVPAGCEPALPRGRVGEPIE